MSLYSRRGVSAQKEEVHQATKGLDKGLYKRAFAKIVPDLIGGDENWVNIMHADGAGTKSILAYLYWKETGDISVWRGIAQDAIVMNLDDLLCVGIYDRILFSSSIDRNKNLIPGEVLKEIIEGTQEFFERMQHHGITIGFLGGETADVGDMVRTIAVNGTMAARWPAAGVVTNEGIAPGNVIVGLASYGRSVYEQEYNSGIGSNGLTSARHDMLEHAYASRFPETFDPLLGDDVAYIGSHRMTDNITVHYGNSEFDMSVGKLLLSPTRTYAPLMKRLLEEHASGIKGLIHCSGGGQTKCMKYMPENVRVVKDNLFPVPEIFRLIARAGGAGNREMFQVFNMGCRMEIYTGESFAPLIMEAAAGFGIEAQIIGRVEAAKNSSLEIIYENEVIRFPET